MPPKPDSYAIQSIRNNFRIGDAPLLVFRRVAGGSQHLFLAKEHIASGSPNFSILSFFLSSYKDDIRDCRQMLPGDW
jgi:hypothetical protein